MTDDDKGEMYVYSPEDMPGMIFDCGEMEWMNIEEICERLNTYEKDTDELSEFNRDLIQRLKSHD